MSDTDNMDVEESIAEPTPLPPRTQTLDPHTAEFILNLPAQERDELHRIRNIILDKLVRNYGTLIEDPDVEKHGGIYHLISYVISQLLDTIAPNSLTDAGLGSSRPVISRDMAKMREIIEYLTHSVYAVQINTSEQQEGRAAVLLALVNLAEQYDNTSDEDSKRDTELHAIDMAYAQQEMLENMKTTPRRGVKRSKSAPTFPDDVYISDLTDGDAIPKRRRQKEKRDIERSKSTQPFLGGRRTRRRKHKRTRNQRNRKKRHSFKKKRMTRRR